MDASLRGKPSGRFIQVVSTEMVAPDRHFFMPSPAGQVAFAPIHVT